MPKRTDSDVGHMRAAIGLARRGLGMVWPNPSVGCVLVRNGAIVGRGWTQPGGRPHAEAVALDHSGDAAAGATAYVTLEPCSHHGGSPPCADALIAAGISDLFVAIEDPDPRVSGSGIRRIVTAGIGVDVGLCAEEATAVTAGFLSRVTTGRPLVTLKLASTVDGRIATRTGESRWITGENARRAGHLMRARHDAILVGSGTAIADDPMLDCRLPGLDPASPVRVVIDGQTALPLAYRLVSSARNIPTWLITTDKRAEQRRNAFAETGVDVIAVGGRDDARVDLPAALQALGGRGITRVLVEGGGRLAASLLSERLIDRLVWFRSSRIIGNDGLPAMAELGIDALADCPSFVREDVRELGDDVMEVYRLGP